MQVQGKVKKWGNSLGIRIQKTIAEQINLKENSEFNITVSDNSLILTPIQKKYTLECLVSGITPQNIHGETDYGQKTGKEEW